MVRTDSPRTGMVLVLLAVLGAATWAGAAGVRPADRRSYLDDEGVLRLRDDHREVALFGVNYYTPFTVDYEGIAARGGDHRAAIRRDVIHFDRLGLDVLRVHVFDRQISELDGTLIENDHLDLFDYLVSECRKRGIYTVPTPIAWWQFHTVNAGFSSRFTKPEMVLDPQAREAQCRYLRQFMRHRNPYTGKTYAEDNAVVAVELINEPLYSSGTTTAQIAGYIRDLAAAVRQTGTVAPIFYNGWHGHEEAVVQAGIEGCSFVWYPTGLVSGAHLTGNYLSLVDDYPRMRLPCLERKAKIVYEFDAADVRGSVMYPAMARAFRSGGAQIATQFQYDPAALADCNYGWQTHYLNLLYTPDQAISFAIAAEVFRSVPRETRFPPYPGNTQFGAFHLDHRNDTSVMRTETTFMHSNTTTLAPPDPTTLRHIAGIGDSPLVTYPGTGTYFLDRIVPGTWWLTVFPDVVWVADPHAATRLDREAARLLWVAHDIDVRLPDLGTSFEVCRRTPGEQTGPWRQSRNGRFPVRPGVYLLQFGGNAVVVEEPPEFWAPKREYATPGVWWSTSRRWREGRDMPVAAEVAFPGVRAVRLVLDGGGSVPLHSAGRYRWEGAIPARLLSRGECSGYLQINHATATAYAPAGADPAARPSPTAILAELEGAQADAFQATGNPAARLTASDAGLVFRCPRFADPPDSAGVRLPSRGAPSDAYSTLVVKARALQASTTRVEIGLVEDGGEAYGLAVPLTSQWSDVRVDLAALGPLWGTGGTGLEPSRIRAVSVVFGSWLYGSEAGQPQGFELAEVRLEHHLPRYRIAVAPADAPMPVFVAGDRPIRPNGADDRRWGLVGGRDPGSTAVEVLTGGFGSEPSCISFKQAVEPDLRRWDQALSRATHVRLVARGLRGATDRLEVALSETDGAAWGTVVPLSRDWQDIDVPLTELRYFGHWREVPGRGGEGDRFDPRGVDTFHACFGAWLYGDRAAQPHGIAIQRVELLTLPGH